MSDDQYGHYPKQSMPKRMNRKRKFDVFSSGSMCNDDLVNALNQVEPFRVPSHALFYVRAEQQSSMEIECKSQQPQSTSNGSSNNNSNNAFALMMNATKNGNQQNNQHQMIGNQADEEMKDNNVNMQQGNTFYPVKDECNITRDVRVDSEWVDAHKAFDDNTFGANERIHEYQMKQGVVVANLDGIKHQNINLHEHMTMIEKWTLDNRYSGFIMNGIFHLYSPHYYWTLLDDHKSKKSKTDAHFGYVCLPQDKTNKFSMEELILKTNSFHFILIDILFHFVTYLIFCTFLIPKK